MTVYQLKTSGNIKSDLVPLTRALALKSSEEWIFRLLSPFSSPTFLKRYNERAAMDTVHSAVWEVVDREVEEEEGGGGGGGAAAAAAAGAGAAAGGDRRAALIDGLAYAICPYAATDAAEEEGAARVVAKERLGVMERVARLAALAEIPDSFGNSEQQRDDALDWRLDLLRHLAVFRALQTVWVRRMWAVKLARELAAEEKGDEKEATEDDVSSLLEVVASVAGED